MTALVVFIALIIIYVGCYIGELIYAPSGVARVKILKEAALCMLIIAVFFVLLEQS